jgi:transposase-like protein
MPTSDVEELLAERGLDVSYETVRLWVLKFGPVASAFFDGVRRSEPRARASTSKPASTLGSVALALR